MGGNLTEPQKIILGILTALFLAAVFVLLLGANMEKSLDHDEHQFIASGALLANEGKLLYKDLAYFHMPNLVLVYAVLFKTTNYNLLAARLFSTVCAWCTLGLIFWLTFGLFRQRRYPFRFLLAAGSVIFVLTNPLFAYTSGKAWNHDLTILLTLLAFLSLNRGAEKSGAKKWMFLSGMLLGLAVGVRLSAAPLVLPFLLMILLIPNIDRRERLVNLSLTFGLGVLVGLLPSLILFALAPQQFLFGNFGYPKYNTIYRQQVGFVEGDVSAIAMTFHGKLQYLSRYVLSAQSNLLLFLAFVFFCLYLNLTDLRRKGPYQFELTFTLLLIPFLLLGSFAPTPAFFQYFYALVPFDLLGVLYAVASFQRQETKLNWSSALLVLIFILSSAYGINAYKNTKVLLTPDKWLPVKAHEIGLEIGNAVDEGPVLTLAPIFPLESGVGIYDEFATGVFAWRIAPFVPEAERRQMGIISEMELPELLDARRPTGILVGHEGHLEQPLVYFAEQNGYQALTLSDGKTLWVAPR